MSAAAIQPGRPVILPVGGDQTGGEVLDTDAGRLVESRAGDVCSLLGILGAATLVVNHRVSHVAGVERVGDVLMTGSMVAAGIDTAIQGRNLIVGDEDRRGAKESTLGTMAYAATGLIPPVALGALAGLHRHPARSELVGLGLLGLNGAVLGYEVAHRAPRIARGEEDLSGYGSLLASLGGFVVAHKMLTCR